MGLGLGQGPVRLLGFELLMKALVIGTTVVRGAAAMQLSPFRHGLFVGRCLSLVVSVLLVGIVAGVVVLLSIRCLSVTLRAIAHAGYC